MATANWIAALDAARSGNLEPARQARADVLAARVPTTAADPSAGEPAPPRAPANPHEALDEYFYARCLAEADIDLPEAIACLRPAIEAAPRNLLFLQTLALALARTGEAAACHEAALIWHKFDLPHDLDLLAAAALTIEAQLRPLPAQPDPMPWPESLPRPPEALPNSDEAECDNLSPASATNAPAIEGFARRRELQRLLGRMEHALLDHEPQKVLYQAAALIGKGLESAELHLLAGMASEEAGLAERARAHLARADQWEPTMLLARTFLGRVYWRLGWNDLALALWRSLPVEGPYDYGRHYHLALGLDAAGDRAGALRAMGIALRDFFYDSRHFNIKRALELWLIQIHTSPPAAFANTSA